MNAVQIQIFTPFKPQLADRVPVAKLDQIMKVSSENNLFVSLLIPIT